MYVCFYIDTDFAFITYMFRASHFVILTSNRQRWVSCMRQVMLTLSGAPSTTSHLDINILSILHHLGSLLG